MEKQAIKNYAYKIQDQESQTAFRKGNWGIKEFP